MTVLVSGIAGFIGYHTARDLISQGIQVVGFDNLNDYYDPELKIARLSELGLKSEDDWNTAEGSGVVFFKIDLTDKKRIFELFSEFNINKVIHLAAQAGVRHSLTNPDHYIDSNISGSLNLLEASRKFPVDHFVYASSSSVYGLNKNQPLKEVAGVNHPISLYAATKRANELIAHSYSHLYNIPTTGLRFFTAYGPWGRPDMALYKFTKAILEEEEIHLYNGGDMYRDFTYITDISAGIVSAMNHAPNGRSDWSNYENDPSRSSAPFNIFNIGRGVQIHLLEFVQGIEEYLGMKARIVSKPLQPGDVVSTIADTEKLMQEVAYQPKISVQEGIAKFVDWYKSYYGIK